MVRVAVALVLGLVAAFASTAAPDASRLLAVRILEPIGTLWVNAIRMIVVPLVVALLVVGIATASDTRRIGRLGLRAVATFYSLLAAVAILIALVAPPLFAGLRLDPTRVAALRATAAGGDALTAQVPSFRDWLVSLVPTNPIGAAAEGALLPLIVFVVVFGFALTRLEAPEREPFVRFFRAVNQAMLVIARWVLAMAPVGVFALAFVLGNQLGTGAVGALGFYLMVQVGLHVAVMIGVYALAVVMGGVRLRRFAAAAAPAQFVALSTRSSFAALPAMIEGATHRLHLPADVTGFVLPLGCLDLSPDVTDQLDRGGALHRSALWHRARGRADRHGGCRVGRPECDRPWHPQRRVVGSGTRVCGSGATRGGDRHPHRRRPDSRPVQDDAERHR